MYIHKHAPRVFDIAHAHDGSESPEMVTLKAFPRKHKQCYVVDLTVAF